MRVAILDLGTNTFHLLIVSVSAKGERRVVFKSKVVVKLGEGAIHQNEIAPIPFQRGIKALKHYREIIDKHKPERIFAFATSAIRSAVNGKDFVREAKAQASIDIEVISGSREAELICYGVRQCVDLSAGRSLIMDIGGGSTEFIICDHQKIFWKHSFNIGAARLLEIFKPSDPITASEIGKLRKFFAKELEILFQQTEKWKPTQLVGSSGSFDTFAEMIGYKFHAKNVIKNANHYEFNIEEFYKLHDILVSSTTMKRMKMKGLIKMRVDMIVLASLCTTFVLERCKLSKMKMSKFALKEGALWNILQKNN